MIPRSLPYINFILASSSLAFQLGVLYPWHVTLDNAFAELQTSHRHQLGEHIRLYESQLKRQADPFKLLESVGRLV